MLQRERCRHSSDLPAGASVSGLRVPKTDRETARRPLRVKKFRADPKVLLRCRMPSLIHDLRFGVRMLRGNPGFTVVSVFTLAIAIAANTTVFGWIDGVLLRPIPGARAGNELTVMETATSSGEFIKTSYPDYRDYRDSLKLISGVTALFGTSLRLGDGENGQLIWAELVTGNFFQVFGVEPELGRFFLPEESAEPPATPFVAVLSHRLWQTQFGGDRNVIGKTIRLNRRPLTVIGVAPPEFQGSMAGLSQDLWAPLTLVYDLNRAPRGRAPMLDNRYTRNLDLFARLKPGVTVEQARAEASARAAELARAYPASNEKTRVTVLPVSEAHVSGAQAVLRWPLRILMAVCAVVLLIACANVANLLLARATARQKEFAIRLSLGARRVRLARQLLTETLVIAGAGAALGILLVPWIAGSLVWLMPPINAPVRFDSGLQLNARMLAWSVGICVVCALISGMAPLLVSLRSSLNETLKESGRSEESGTRAHRMRGLLVVCEVALAALALIGAGLFVKSFHGARQLKPGFDPSNVLITRFALADSGYPVERQHEFCRRLRQRLETAPGVTAVTYADMAPMGFDQGPWQDLSVEGYVPAKGENMLVYRTLAAPGYFSLLRIPLVEGRDFTEQDDEKAPDVAIVNQAFARRYFAGANPVGRRIRAWGRWLTVVGMSKDVKHHSLAEPPTPYFYTPFRQRFSTGLAAIFYVRTAGDPTAAVAMVRREAAALDPGVGVVEAMPLGEYMGSSLYPLKLAATLLGVLGGISVLMAAVGLYSVMAYAVSQRTHELGIRMAVGAQPRDVLGLVMRQGLALTAAGLAAGILAALAVTHAARGLLVNVSPADPIAFAAAAAFLALVAMLASYVPARRATKVDPMVALRCE